MRQKIKSIVQRTGYSVVRNETVEKARKYPFIEQKLLRTIQDYETLFRATMFPDLPTNRHRHELMLELTGNSVIEAFYILNYLHKSLPLDGVVCEFGVYDGTNSTLIANEILRDSKELWLFDSFEGLSEPTEKDVLINDIFDLGDMKSYAGKMAYPMEKVVHRVGTAGFPKNRLNIVPGFIEKIPESKWPKNVCFAYVDLDFYEPIKITLEALNSRLAKGAYVVVDDYGYFSAGAQTAVDEFCQTRRTSYQFISPAPAAKGFIILKKK